MRTVELELLGRAVERRAALSQFPPSLALHLSDRRVFRVICTHSQPTEATRRLSEWRPREPSRKLFRELQPPCFHLWRGQEWQCPWLCDGDHWHDICGPEDQEVQAEQPTEVYRPTSVSQIKEKVLEHSHRLIHLRKGDFYSYLSLSSHDSDCGEVSTCAEDKSSTPILSTTPDIRDEEPLFEACTEEVYLGPPLCYSMSISKRPTRHGGKLIEPLGLPSPAPSPGCDEYQKAHGISQGSVAGSQPECHNEAPYLNPLPCETPIDTVECFADTKMLESNISPVMTKIRVSCSTTNPLKEDGSLYINPKINCPLIRKTDSDERAPASQLMKQKNVGKGRRSLQEAKSTHKQVCFNITPRSICL